MASLLANGSALSSLKELPTAVSATKIVKHEASTKRWWTDRTNTGQRNCLSARNSDTQEKMYVCTANTTQASYSTVF